MPIGRVVREVASASSAVVAAAWLGTSALFGAWASSVASYRSASAARPFSSSLPYCFTSAAILLVGVEIDERSRRAEG